MAEAAKFCTFASPIIVGLPVQALKRLRDKAVRIVVAFEQVVDASRERYILWWCRNS